MNNPFDYIPDSQCDGAFKDLLARIERLAESGREEDLNFVRHLAEGKMLGVMIAEDPTGHLHNLYAFSGQAGDIGFRFPGFVEPAFNYLDPDGHFKSEETCISALNDEILFYEESRLPEAFQEYADAEAALKPELEELLQRNRESKRRREAARSMGQISKEDLIAMQRQSQFEKGEARRLKKSIKERLSPLLKRLEEIRHRIASLKLQRKEDSETLQNWLFSNFRLLNARGEEKSLSEIFAATSMAVPPSGAGECCAPKLLQAAYRRGWRPVAMAEYWYGASKGGELRIHGQSYPACRGKCLPVLRFMLEGLAVDPPLDGEFYSSTHFQPEILFENEWFCVVSKPAGMLSVPGKGSAISVEEWLQIHYGPERDVKPVHRLDQDTSGLLIAAFGREAYKAMQSLFALRRVKKMYTAILEGDYRAKGISSHGNISLPIIPDWLDRPRQKIDFIEGKEAATDYQFISSDGRFSRIRFYPLTGRTHQLRVHAASSLGLGMPIAGDPLYGTAINSRRSDRNQRLMLHATEIDFILPFDNHRYHFKSDPPF